MTRRLVLFGLLIGLVPASARATSGGPDTFGYTWTDDVDPATEGITDHHPLILAGDEVSPPLDIGFSFPFHGASYTQLVVSSNGWISFDTTLTNSHPVPQALPAASVPNKTIAWFWRDLDRTTTNGSSYWGAFNGGFMVRVVTQIPGGSSDSVIVTTMLYQSGMIKVSYEGLDVPETGSAGIENAPGDDGLNPSYLGTGENGFVLEAGKAITYFPPPQLNCASPGVIACGQTLTFSSPATLSPNVEAYVCGTTKYLGRERVIRFDNPALNDVTISLTAQPVGADMDLFLLKQGMCNEFQCIDGGKDSVSQTFLGTGSYDIVVDGKKDTDNGSFSLRVDCTPKSAVLNCQNTGDPPVRGATSGTSVWNLYPCNGRNFDGPEFVYEIPFTAPGNIKVRLTPDPNVLLDVMAFGPNVFDAPDGCIASGDNGLTVWNASSGTYYIVVDGYTEDPSIPPDTNGGGFGIGVTCGIQLSCAAPVGDLQCYQTTSGTTVGATNKAEVYSCNGNVFDGPEVVYTFHNDVRRTVAFKWTGPPDLTPFLIQSNCNEGACLRFGNNGRLVARDLPVGDYFVVVDGKNAASGAFTLKPICDNKVEPPSGSWTLDPTQTVHEVKALSVTGEPTYGDIMFAIDDTGSMGAVIENLKATSQTIINQLSTQVDDVSFGLVNFEDYGQVNPGTSPCGTAGYGGPLPYHLALPVTNNIVALNAAIDALFPHGGGDGPESYLYTYFQMYADSGNIGWRPGARQIVVMEGDNDAHACETSCGHTPNGPELGPDFAPGTADDIEPTPLFAEYTRRGIQPFFMQTSGNAGLLSKWDCWTGMAGGRAYDAVNGALPPGFVLDIRRVIESRALICFDLNVVPTPGFEAWVTNVTPPSMQNVYLPTEVTFDLDVGPPAGTPPGVYDFDIDFVCDGGVKATQTVSITVPGVCTPQVAVSLSGRTCPGDSRTLDASGSTIPGCPAPAVVEWQWKDSLGGVVQPWSATGSVYTATPSLSTFYTVEIRCSDQAACPIIGTRGQAVPVDPNPPADAGPDTVLCLTESVMIGTPAVAGLTYSWSPQTELDNPNIAQPNFSTGATAPTGPRVYTLTVTDPATGCVSTDTVTVLVTSGAPLGAIGNRLWLAKRTPSVDLQWRLGLLSIRNYNVHRESSKFSLDPPSSPPIGSIGGDEIYTDVGAVPIPALLFYEVYGRDCAGNSIFN